MTTQLSLPAGKADFNFDEAASLLGMSVEELQVLVIERLGEEDTSAKKVARMRFRPADLVLLNVMQSASGGVAAGLS